MGFLAGQVFTSAQMLAYLIDPIHEVHWYTEGQRMMIRVAEQGRQDFHSRGPCLPITILLGSFHTSLAINGIFAKLCPGIQNLKSNLRNLFETIENMHPIIKGFFAVHCLNELR